MELDAVKERVAGYWDRWADGYDLQYAHGLKGEAEKEAWMELLDRELESCREVLDVGTGTGFLAHLAACCGKNCVGVDIAEEMLGIARRRAMKPAGNPVFLKGDAEQLPFPDGSFDAVMNRHLLWTLPHPERALQEWHRVLKPGGKVLIINAAWSTFGWQNKALSFLGNLLIAVQERKNPWSDNYEKMVGEQMPLLTAVRPEQIAGLLGETGFHSIQYVDMEKVCAAELAVMPLRYRLAYRHERYTITGIK